MSRAKDKRNVKNILAWGIIIFIILFFVAAIHFFLEIDIKIEIKDLLNKENFKNIVESIFNMMFVDIFIVLMIVMIIGGISIVVIFGGIYGIKIAIKIVKRIHIKSKLEKIDFKNNSYYRDIIERYSIAAISYIDSFKVEKKDIVAVILELEMKRKIKIEEKIKIIDTNDKELTETERYIFDILKNRKINKIDIIKYEDILIQECKDKNLFKTRTFLEQKFSNKVIVILTLLWMLVIFISCCLVIALSAKVNSINIVMLLFPACFFALLVGPMYLGKLRKTNPYVRSKEGKILNQKIEGLRKYLKDYSNMGEKEKNELILWEDYLIYSVIFNQNKKIIEEIYNKI